jgi:hypothetical protein
VMRAHAGAEHRPCPGRCAGAPRLPTPRLLRRRGGATAPPLSVGRATEAGSPWPDPSRPRAWPRP